MKTYTMTGLFGSVEDIISALPFCYNETNSDIAVEMFIDGEVTITVTFGTGKGWDNLEKTLSEETEKSFAWGAYTMGYSLQY